MIPKGFTIHIKPDCGCVIYSNKDQTKFIELWNPNCKYHKPKELPVFPNKLMNQKELDRTKKRNWQKLQFGNNYSKKKLLNGLKPKKDKRVYFSGESQKTLDSWSGGRNYKHLFHFELFGIKLEFWKKI